MYIKHYIFRWLNCSDHYTPDIHFYFHSDTSLTITKPYIFIYPEPDITQNIQIFEHIIGLYYIHEPSSIITQLPFIPISNRCALNFKFQHVYIYPIFPLIRLIHRSGNHEVHSGKNSVLKIEYLMKPDIFGNILYIVPIS